jgi:hypothetical protein
MGMRMGSNERIEGIEARLAGGLREFLRAKFTLLRAGYGGRSGRAWGIF